ncbi:MAG: hypothetical protein LBG87_03650 [Spirochaetaceae bacterium]|nr:hypothetical protein [Spirochaetaceae bacterium]
MQIAIELKCPQYHSGNIVRNGKKINSSGIISAKTADVQFISDHEKNCRGCLTGIAELVKIILVRGVGYETSAQSSK